MRVAFFNENRFSEEDPIPLDLCDREIQRKSLLFGEEDIERC